MRFRLRTLMIVIVFAGAAFARIAYLKRMADFHSQKLAQQIASIAAHTRYSEDFVFTSVRDMVSQRPAAVAQGINQDPEHPRISEDLRMAYLHQIMTLRYQHSIYRPWQPVSETIEP